jgi:hypothetical protein
VKVAARGLFFGILLFLAISSRQIRGSFCSGNYVLTWGYSGWTFGAVSPDGLAVDAAGNVYAADQVNNMVEKFSSTGSLLASWGGTGYGNGQFYQPTGIAVDSSGKVYVVDAGNTRVEKFTSTGVLLATWQGAAGTSYWGVAIDGLDNVYVTDSYANKIYKFNSNGILLSQWGGTGTGNGQFQTPIGIAVDKSNCVYVFDFGNYRVQKFDSSGGYVTQWGSYGTAAGQFDAPFSWLAVDCAYNVFVTDYHRVQQFDSVGTFVNQWGSSGTGNGQFALADGIAVDSLGNVFVGDPANNSSGTTIIQKFSCGVGFHCATPSPGCPALSPTMTQSPTHTTTPTPSVSPTVTLSGTFSETATITATWSVSPTMSPTPSQTPTFTMTATATKTPPPFCLDSVGTDPSPTKGDGTYIHYDVCHDSQVQIQIFSISGEGVRVLGSFDAKAGNNEEFWDCKNSYGKTVANGVYIFRILATSKVSGASEKAFGKCAVLR